MHIYKFRLLSTENDEFIRDIEIMANQTFKDLHDTISSCAKMNGNELASFHICDQSWTKNKEITLMDMRFEMETEGADLESQKQTENFYLMDRSLIRDFMDEPHQRLVYEYDFLDMITLFIELHSVRKLNDDYTYPRCTKSIGELLAQPVPMVIEENDSEITEELLADFDELLDDTFEYKGDNPGEFY